MRAGKTADTGSRITAGTAVGAYSVLPLGPPLGGYLPPRLFENLHRPFPLCNKMRGYSSPS